MPKILFEEGLDAYVVRELGLPFHDVDWDEWADLLERVHHPKHEVNIAIVGKYIDLPDAYLSVTEAIKAGGFANWAKVNVSGLRPIVAKPPKVRPPLSTTSTAS